MALKYTMGNGTLTWNGVANGSDNGGGGSFDGGTVAKIQLLAPAFYG